MKTLRPLVIGFIAIATIASILCGLGAFDGAVVDAFWVLLPDEAPAPYNVPDVRISEQPDPLLSLLSSRAPPSLLHA